MALSQWLREQPQRRNPSDAPLNQPSQQAEPTAQAPETTSNGVTHVPSLQERSAAAFSDSPETAAESAESSQPSSTPADTAAVSAEDTPEKRAAERRARIEAYKADERQRVDAQQRHRDRDALERRAAEAERERDEIKAKGAGLDPSTLTEEQFLNLAEKINVSPQKLGELIRERMLNPEAVAARAAVTSVDPKIAALEKKLAAQDAAIRSFLDQQQAQAVHHQEAQAAHEFNSFVTENAASAPYSASFLKIHGGNEFYKLAHSAAASVPPGAGWQAVLDQIEENLSSMAPIYAPQGATAQQRPALPKPNPAAAKATTVSNSSAQGRASIVDEEANWASLPFAERSARLFR